MSHLMKALPIRRPSEMLKSECSIRTIHYLCPHCNKVYTSEVSTSIFYDKIIDRAEEGIVVTTKYFCRNCGDYAFEIDEEIIPAVSLLRSLKINTVSSCSGHAEKFGQRSFHFEGGALAINDQNDEDYITYGPCISMLPPKNNEIAYFAFKDTFERFQGTSLSKHNVMLCSPDGFVQRYFFIAPVYDAKEFRRAGIQRREIMLKCANKHMYNFVRRFCTEYQKQLKNLKEEK